MINLDPVNVFNQYIEWHSVNTLRREINNNNDNNNNHHQKQHSLLLSSERRYAVGYYSCPLQAGNRIHHFMNSILWSIITNRTLLWKYYDYETCQRIGSKYDIKHCDAANTTSVEICDTILQRASWIPSYDEWMDRIDVDDNDDTDSIEIFDINHWLTHPMESRYVSLTDASQNYSGFTSFHYAGRKKNPIKLLSKEQYDDWIGIDDKSKYDKYQIINFPMMLDKYHDLANATYREELLKTDDGRGTAKRLYSLDANFLYGMLFRRSFSISDNILPPRISPGPVIISAEGAVPDPRPSSTYSIAIHSRHPYDDVDGDNITKEIDCLTELLQSRREDQKCQVYILSDRIATIDRLSEWLINEDRDCQPMTAIHNVSSTTITSSTSDIPNFHNEHGPYSGIGFYQDLQLSSYARSGFIGGSRSSSNLVIELMTYDKIMELITQQSFHNYNNNNNDNNHRVGDTTNIQQCIYSEENANHHPKNGKKGLIS